MDSRHKCLLLLPLEAMNSVPPEVVRVKFPDVPEGVPVLGQLWTPNVPSAKFSFPPAQPENYKNSNILGLKTILPDEYIQVAVRLGIEVDLTKFEISRPTPQSVHTAFSYRTNTWRGKFQGANSKLLALAVDFIVESLPKITRLTSLENITVTQHGATGCTYASCGTKLRAFQVHNTYIKRYVEDVSPPRPVFTYQHKIEPLAKLKVRSHATRPIVYPPVDFYYKQAQYTTDLDDCLKHRYHPWVYYGYNPFSYATHELCSQLKRFKYKFMGDCTKYDGSIGPEMMSIICDVRKKCMPDSSGVHLDYIYDCLSNNKVLLPSGAIVPWSSQPSGSRTTTSDNCIAHLVIIYYMVLNRLMELHLPLTRESVEKYVFYAIYSDDHVGATDDPVLASFEYRHAKYRELGFELKKDDDLVTQSLDGLTFLSNNLAFQIGGTHVWQYSGDLDKFWHVPFFDGTTFADSLRSYVYLTFTRPDGHLWRQLYNALIGDGQVKSDQQLLKAAMGDESRLH